MPRVWGKDLDIGQVVIFKAYKTMTIFCGVDNNRGKNILLWSENSGARWITETWFNSRYSFLVYNDQSIEDDRDKKVFKGLVCTRRDSGAETLSKERAAPVRYIDEITLKDRAFKEILLSAVRDAETRYDSGEIKIPVYHMDDCVCYLLLCFALLIIIIAVWSFIENLILP